jgi:hypothetical protein
MQKDLKIRLGARVVKDNAFPGTVVAITETVIFVAYDEYCYSHFTIIDHTFVRDYEREVKFILNINKFIGKRVGSYFINQLNDANIKIVSSDDNILCRKK